jgi:hypothetical protein
MSLGATLSASLLAVLERPSTWPLALVGFLVRGGWLLVLAPIVVLPTAVGLANAVAPLLEDVAFGRRTDQLVVLVGLVVSGIAVWLLGGGLLAAAAEVEGVRRVAAEAGSTGPGPIDAGDRPGRAWRVLVVRLAAHVPLLIALAWGAMRIAMVGYRELTVPSDVAVPAAWRIVAGAPDAIVGVIVTWLIGETLGAMAARRVILRGDGARVALRASIRRLVTAPRRPLAFAVISSIALVAVVAVTGIAAGVAWDGLRATLAAGEPVPGMALVVVFVALFAGGLVLISLAAAWRSAIWTVDASTEEDGTFGGVGRTRSGD